MPLLRRSTAGSFVGHRLTTPDVEATAAFYGRLFDWTPSTAGAADAAGAVALVSGDVEVARLVPAAGASTWLPCLAVTDLARLTTAVEQAGGALAGGLEAPDRHGHSVIDPSGARVDLCVAGLGGGRAGAAAVGRVCWNELVTGEPTRAAGFYQALVGWTHVEWNVGPGGRYWLFRMDGRDTAGMMQDDGEAGGPGWVPYVQVVSAEDSAALAAELGATIVVEPGDVPGRGRYAVLLDPCGARFAVFALTEAA